MLKHVIIVIFMSIVSRVISAHKIFIKYKTHRTKHKTYFKLGLSILVPVTIRVGYLEFQF